MDKDLRKQIGAKLREEREYLDLTQQEAANGIKKYLVPRFRSLKMVNDGWTLQS